MDCFTEFILNTFTTLSVNSVNVFAMSIIESYAVKYKLKRRLYKLNLLQLNTGRCYMNHLFTIFIVQVILWMLLFVLIYYFVKKNAELKKEIKLLKDAETYNSNRPTERSR